MMSLKYVLLVFLGSILGFAFVQAKGLLLLYRPRDISTDCAFSRHLRFDLSFGMGMSDTITLVLRTMAEIDYECQIDIVTERDDRLADVRLLVVVRFPNNIGFNCQHNPTAFIILKKEECFLLCDVIETRDAYASYFASVSLTRFRFQFTSNSSINSDMNAHLYEVTATSARLKRKNETCNKTNETICAIDSDEFCLTSGVVCDGIKNCGADDWFDERKSECELPVQRLGLTPVVAVSAMIVCALLAATHILMQCLPPLAESFFIFNTNEDNRFCIDPMFKGPGTDPDFTRKEDINRRKSLIPVDMSGSSDDDEEGDEPPKIITPVAPLAPTQLNSVPSNELEHKEKQRKPTLRTMSERIQQRLRSMAGRARVPRESGAPDAQSTAPACNSTRACSIIDV